MVNNIISTEHKIYFGSSRFYLPKHNVKLDCTNDFDEIATLHHQPLKHISLIKNSNMMIGLSTVIVNFIYILDLNQKLVVPKMFVKCTFHQ